MRIHIYNKSYSNNHRIIIYIYMYRGVQYCYSLLEFNIYNRNIIFIFICIHTQLIRLSALALATPRRVNISLFFFLFLFFCLPFCPYIFRFPLLLISLSGPFNGVFFYRNALVFRGKKSCVCLLPIRSRKASSNSFRNLSKFYRLYISHEHAIPIFSYCDRSAFILQNIHYSLAAFG